MNFLVTYKAGIAKGTVSGTKIMLTPYLSLEGASYLDTDKHYIYSISTGGICVYKDEILIYQDTQFKHKPSHILWIPKYELIITSNYHLGLFSLYQAKGDDVTFLESIHLPQGSQIHQAYYDAALDLLFIVNLGLDHVYTYKISNQTVYLHHTLNFPEKSGPRHLCISKKGYIYVVSEYHNDVYVFDSNLNLIQKHTSLNFSYQKSDSSAIRLAHKEDLLFVANRFEDYITTFNILSDGTLQLLEVTPTHGKHARDFNISKDDKHLVIANKDTHSLTLFHINDQKLTFISETSLDEPTMIKVL